MAPNDITPGAHYTISPAMPMAPLLSVLSNGQIGVVPRMGRDDAPENLWRFFPASGEDPNIFNLFNRKAGEDKALAIDPGSRTVELQGRSGRDEQKWLVIPVHSGGGFPSYRLSNLAAGDSISLELGDEGKVVLGHEGGVPFKWVLNRMGEDD
ncbi:hypothetical protein B0T16DRAFT_393020 [Cercophora newfieldiana]|uniref:Uncharacterized protein n=1 Tax=Cercophora newfieldiana TaxID=92897 RepID=A0AA40CKN9_9PEZI|nr:hypothetical protein B0T16DRAFT_393020 [Cercophora newfieldiana]